MFVNKYISFIVATMFAVCECIQVGAGWGESFIRDQFVGTWYTIGTITPGNYFTQQITCHKYNIMNNTNDSTSFFYNDVSVISNVPISFAGYGAILKSEIHLTIPLLSRGANVYSARSYNRGEQLMMKSRYENYYELTSRHLRVPPDVMTTFYAIAADSDNVTLLTHRGCPY